MIEDIFIIMISCCDDMLIKVRYRVEFFTGFLVRIFLKYGKMVNGKMINGKMVNGKMVKW